MLLYFLQMTENQFAKITTKLHMLVDHLFILPLITVVQLICEGPQGFQTIGGGAVMRAPLANPLPCGSDITYGCPFVFQLLCFPYSYLLWPRKPVQEDSNPKLRWETPRWILAAGFRSVQLQP